MKGDKFTFLVSFWAFIGPFMSLCTAFVFYAKGSYSYAYLPLVLLLGTGVSWKWQLKGFFGALLALILLLTIYYHDIPLDERLWHLGMACAVSLSLLITSLSFEEVAYLVDGLKLESKSRLENLWKLDEKLQLSLEEIKKKKERNRDLNIKLRSYQKLVDRSTEELIDLRTKRVELEQELGVLQEKYDRLFKQFKAAPSADTHYQQLLEKYELRKKQLLVANERILMLEKELDELQKYDLNEVEKALERHLLNMEKEQKDKDDAYHQELDALHDMIAELIKDHPQQVKRIILAKDFKSKH